MVLPRVAAQRFYLSASAARGAGGFYYRAKLMRKRACFCQAKPLGRCALTCVGADRVRSVESAAIVGTIVRSRRFVGVGGRTLNLSVRSLRLRNQRGKGGASSSVAPFDSGNRSVERRARTTS